jgi:hypothetical protein
MRPRFQVSDEIKWGKLVKSWATGSNYMGTGPASDQPSGPPIPLPRTIPELVKLCSDLGITISIPDFHKGLVIIQSSEEIFSIRLPPKSMVEETEADMRAGNAYVAPKFYDDFYDKQLVLGTMDKRFEFHAARIGDYSIRMCG